MKLLISSILFSIFSIVPVSGQLQEGDLLESTYDLFDSLIHLNDSLGIYSQARQYADNGLKFAEKEKDADRQTFYQLKLAKYYYLDGNTQQSLIHFRLYAISNASSIQFKKELEMQDLENAYLDEIEHMYAEWALDKDLIDNLQNENFRYVAAQKKISLAIKIGLGALLV
ncbi:MAG: hypothetical protein O6848_01685, partial [Bacteroidetes bacterium]|nr:hypothetical protein [Bacteroidota bacterium]